MMNLDDAQRQKVTAWIAQGLTLSEIQTKLTSELGLSLTYMEVRFLIDDLKLKPKDKEPPAQLPAAGPQGGASAAPTPASAKGPAPSKTPPLKPEESRPAPAGGVALTVDHLAKPGAIVSGKVTFSDGNKAEWYLDQFGRLGLVPAQQGYKPSPQDLQEFQIQLQDELQRLGM